MSQQHEFKGWDWTELFQLFPTLSEEYDQKCGADNAIPYPEPGNWIDAEAEMGQKLARAICGYAGGRPQEETDEFVGHLRTFLEKVASASGYYEPYFRGILAIQNQEVFLQVFSWHVTCMWT